MNMHTHYEQLFGVALQNSTRHRVLKQKADAYASILTILKKNEDAWEMEGERLLSQAKSSLEKNVYTTFLETLRAENPSLLLLRGRYTDVDAYILWHNLRAKRAGRAATLTVEQWKETLEYFHHRCAYCQRALWECLEHFIPITRGGGTAWDNCVPACSYCDQEKGVKLLSEGIGLPADDLARVQTYLQSKK